MHHNNSLGLLFLVLQRDPTDEFPLYTEAIKYIHHENRMVRIAVRTLTLNVYKSKVVVMMDACCARTEVWRV